MKKKIEAQFACWAGVALIKHPSLPATYWTRSTTYWTTLTDDAALARRYVPIHRSANVRAGSRSDYCSGSGARSQLSLVAPSVVYCSLLPAACAWLGGAARRPRPRLPASVLDSLIRLRRCALVVACECNAAARRCGAFN